MVDSMGASVLRRERVMFAASALAAMDAGPLSVVTVPWGRLDDRVASGRTFPADDQALLASGHDHLVGRDDLVVTPDVEAAVPELLAARTMRYGLECLGGIDLIVCLDGEGVRAWGTAFHRKNAFPGSLDVFIGECLSGDLLMEPPGSGLGAVTGVEGWQALVFPSAFFDEWSDAPRMGSSPSHRTRRERALEALERVGLAGHAEHLPRQLSGGQEQRVAIARALVTNPSMILADEPTGNLDTRSRDDVLQHLLNARERGVTLIIVTHDPAVAALAPRIVRMQDGHIATAVAA